MRKRSGVLLIAVVMLAAACGGDDEDDEATTSQTTLPAGAQTVEVSVDAETDAFNGAFLAYFPKKVTVHPGDTVSFFSNFNGEPHSVTMGTLVDEGVPAAVAAGPEAEQEPEALQKIPHMLPEGDGDAIQAGVQPCFRKGADPPAQEACSQAEQQQPEFDGTYRYFNSGFLADGERFNVSLADGIAPGVYNFFCNLHRAGMTGTIEVVADDRPAPTADAVSAAGQAELDSVVDRLRPAADNLRKGLLPPFVSPSQPGAVRAGGGSEEVEEALINEFGPKDVRVGLDQPVTWTIIGPHTISFNASESLRTFLTEAPDGSVHLNPESFTPAGGPGQPAPPEEQRPGGGGAEEGEDESAPDPPVVVDGGSFDGTGFRSSGIFFSSPGEGFFAYKLTFTKAGTYSYACLIHPAMEGTVTVA